MTVLPILLISYTITIVSAIISDNIFGKNSTTKRKLLTFLNKIRTNKWITNYFSLAYLFHTWLFCVGENKKLRFRFNLIISIMEILTIFSLFFRSLILFLDRNIPGSILIFAAILFAFNGLFRAFIKSGIFISNLDDNRILHTGPEGNDEDLLDSWVPHVSRYGNDYVQRNYTAFGNSDNFEPDPEDPKKPNVNSTNKLRRSSTSSSQNRYGAGQKWVIYGTIGSILVGLVVPHTIEYRRQNYETNARVEQQQQKIILSAQKTERKQLEYDVANANAVIAQAHAVTAQANAVTAQANAVTTQANADALRHEVELARLKKSEPKFSVLSRIQDSWNQKK